MYMCICTLVRWCLTEACPYPVPPSSALPSQSELKGAKAALRDMQVEHSSVRQQLREATEAWKTAEEQVRSSQQSHEMLQLEMDTLKKEKSILSKVRQCVCVNMHTSMWQPTLCCT